MALSNNPVVLGASSGIPSGASSIVGGPGSSTDNAVVRWDGTTGQVVQNSSVTVSDSAAGIVTLATTVTNDSFIIAPNGTGFVGIGSVTSPEALLHMQRSSSGGTTTLFIDNNATTALNNGAALRLAVDSGSTVSNGGGEVKAICTNAGNGAVALLFTSYTGSGNQEHARFTADGDLTMNVGHFNESVDAKSGAGAISVTRTATKLTTTAADALTLADGINGQIKRITMIADGGDGTLTPTTKTGYTTITFTAVGNSVTLQFYTTQGWMIVNNYGCTIA